MTERSQGLASEVDALCVALRVDTIARTDMAILERAAGMNVAITVDVAADWVHRLEGLKAKVQEAGTIDQGMIRQIETLIARLKSTDEVAVQTLPVTDDFPRSDKLAPLAKSLESQAPGTGAAGDGEAADTSDEGDDAAVGGEEAANESRYVDGSDRGESDEVKLADGDSEEAESEAAGSESGDDGEEFVD